MGSATRVTQTYGLEGQADMIAPIVAILYAVSFAHAPPLAGQMTTGPARRNLDFLLVSLHWTIQCTQDPDKARGLGEAQPVRIKNMHTTYM